MDDESCGLVELLGIPQRSQAKTGGQKRRAANSLPRVLLLSRAGAKCIVGAILVTAAYAVFGSTLHHVHIASFVRLCEACPVETSSYAYRSTLSKLKPDVFSRIANSSVTVGGTVNDHYPKYGRPPWLIINLARTQYDAILGQDDHLCHWRFLGSMW